MYDAFHSNPGGWDEGDGTEQFSKDGDHLRLLLLQSVEFITHGDGYIGE